MRMMQLSMNDGGEEPGDVRPTQSFRDGHEVIHQALDRLEQRLDSLALAGPAEQREIMDEVISYLAATVQPQMEWEERALYPAVDRHGSAASLSPTATMRYEHRIIERWATELSRERTRPVPNAKAFLRRADMVLGLVRAHLEKEEEVLLPVLDEAMRGELFEP